MVFDGIVACSASACWPSTPTPPSLRGAGHQGARRRQACQWRTVILPPSPPPGDTPSPPATPRLSGSGHCRHQSLGRVLASIRDRTNIVTETAFSSCPWPRPAPEPGKPGLHADDSHPGAEPAPDPGRPRPHRPGQDRQRQDRRLRPGPAAEDQPSWLAPQCLVLCPTRELADQVAQELRRLARQISNIKVLTLCGGAAVRPRPSRWPTAPTSWSARRAASRTTWRAAA